MEAPTRTTLTIEDSLLAEFKQLAARSHRSLSGVIQDALREALTARQAHRPLAPVDLPEFRGGSGLQPGVDLDSTAALLDLMDTADAVLGRSPDGDSSAAVS
jgi:hypothetical protein